MPGGSLTSKPAGYLPTREEIVLSLSQSITESLLHWTDSVVNDVKIFGAQNHRQLLELNVRILRMYMYKK